MGIKTSFGCLLLLSVVVGLVPIQTVCAATIYVNNRIGSDALDGKSSGLLGAKAGPVRTIRRALRIADSADIVVLANTGTPYYESIQLFGKRHSGIGIGKFTIIGNGAVVSGARLVLPKAWRLVGSDLWKLTPWRKGHYQLILDAKPLPEHKDVASSADLLKIPPGHWAAWRGSIYFKTKPLESPDLRNYAIAMLSVGLTLCDVRDVQVIGVTFRHFRLDGINAHDRCRNVVFDDVKSIENGRAGLVVAGSSSVRLVKSELANNRVHSLMVTERGDAVVDKSTFSQPPTVIQTSLEVEE